MDIEIEVQRILEEIVENVATTENIKLTSTKNKRIRKKDPNAAVKRMNRDKEKYPILLPCESLMPGSKKGCTKNCAWKILSKKRQEIYDNFWKMNDKDEQDRWIAHMFEVVNPVRPRSTISGKKEKTFTHIYYLEADEDERSKVRVCQKMFLATLGLKG